MVAAEFKTTISTVRIHDEYCELATERHISDLGRIISASYKRRQLSNWGEGSSPELAAAHFTADVRES